MRISRAVLSVLFAAAAFGLLLSFDPSRGAAQGRGNVAAIVDAEPEAGLRGARLAVFYQKRGNAAGRLGRVPQSVQDLRRALKISQRHGGPVGLIARDLATTELRAGNPRGFLAAARARVEVDKSEPPGRRIAGMAVLARALLVNGRINDARDLIDDMESIADRLPARVPQRIRGLVETFVEESKGRFLAVTGKHEEAEKVFVETIAKMQDLLPALSGNPRFGALLNSRLSSLQLGHARLLMNLGREGEAEALVRDAVNRNIRDGGKTNTKTAISVDWLARTLAAQGRFAEAETLGREAVEIMRDIGMRPKSVTFLRAQLGVAQSLAGQERWQEAAEILRDIEKLVGENIPLRRRTISANIDGALIFYKVGDIDSGLRLAIERSQGSVKRLGEKHFRSAMSIAFVAVGKSLKGDHENALADYRRAVPILLSSSRQVEDEDTTRTAREIRVRAVLEGYMNTLANIYGNVTSPEQRAEIAAEAFRISDAARGSTVQRAVAQSSARAAARDPQLAKLVRAEQDLLRQISALFGLLTTLQSAPEGEGDPGAADDLREQIDDLRGARADAREALEDRFPDYIRLIDPPPSELGEVRNALADDESILVTYVSDDRTYVWAFGRSGDIGFRTVTRSKADLGEAASRLRRALDPQAVTLADIPDFDTGLAHELFQRLMAPVSTAWMDTPHLIVVADGPLGQVPFSLLPTASATVTDKTLLFDGYRDVPWLTRSHSVTVMPSVASLVALRSLSNTGTADRAFLGFGDPVFADGQLAQTPLPEAKDAVVSRGGLQLRNIPVRLRSLPRTQGVDTAEFSRLPRLPDTADEIQAMATALKADHGRDVFLGEAAAEPSVRAAPLDQYRVIAFATHGLVPGDLRGLVEPALALTAPHIAGDADGDGLLQMGEIFELEMNADWVVLSACNTGTASGAGAEAVSGLGRAFFYAGTRALLVSNWPVETTSARILTTDVFDRQAANPGLTRAEALRQAQVALIDSPGFPDPRNGRPLFSYAHPIFWAPFSLIGEGGDFKVAAAPIRSSRPAADRSRSAPQVEQDNFQVFGD